MKFHDKLLVVVSMVGALVCNALAVEGDEAVEKQITKTMHGHVLTNIGVWSPDGKWIVYDVRSDAAGDTFDGQRIERVHIDSGEVQVLFESRNGAHCGVATYSAKHDRVVFIHGPEHPDADWQYAAFHRRGVLVDANKPGIAVNLDARDLVSPYTTGALRGGTHVHTFSPDGQWVSFTYEDHVLHGQQVDSPNADMNQRNVGVCVPAESVDVPQSHPRNHPGSHFTVLVTRTTNRPRPGSDEISRAFSDAWIGQDGYERTDGRQQKRAIAFQGHVQADNGDTIAEVFVVDLPQDVSRVGESGPLSGTRTIRPRPPLGTIQRRLTFTSGRKYPGIQGVRHWLRSSPDGSQIAFLMKSELGVSQLWTISPMGGQPMQLTDNEYPISSAFSWSPDGNLIAHTMNESVCVTLVDSGKTIRLTKPKPEAPLRPEACVFSPDGSKIAYVRHVTNQGKAWNQIFVLVVRKATEMMPPELRRIGK